ncbi:Protein of uncharacterised function (DUF2531) [Shigella flexneri]|uniref:Protein of uncharacterized function (DUF2531) n=1 Tax=Shigella flexneri TaxID=623 RepID=A0A658YSI3_SHIFL|nr:hypothetical protein SFy_4848 [Shigella flexneri 2003036]AIL42657.1 hypothetical protein SFyv_4923 [Shigella flexneri Shi06HN006]EGJ79927.1 hypothetical protein SFK671_4856 [Shigella flexneri K-671]EGJ81256.1 hypothetical protein SF274771_4899 [Shigella flexneri 2747-71]EGK31896.1 hypothetical protein SFK304_5108 [Shigella flexneri K-304]EIQ20300.1 hypothetical protein SFK404_5234 [Shigella flexneri K-404]CDX08803.1 Protein of unknown function (DUF2531) [Shigella flexneri]CEP56261.1 Prote
MRVKRWLLAGIALCLLTGMRDPFKSPEDLYAGLANLASGAIRGW